ncbi:MAG: transporter substrate-binding domain-containing protein [Lachnospiraceae bacterium]|nr:transporter substrate-binding domain-containing protein [Lachnospiraceae bacterium]
MKKTVCIVLPVLILILLAACGAKKSPDEITSLAQLNETGRKIGVTSDSTEDRLVEQKFPKAEIKYFKDEISGYTAAGQGKIDAFVYSRMNMETAIYQGLEGVRILDETMGTANTSAVAISPVTQIPDLEEKINAFLKEIREDGTMDSAKQRWLIRHDETMPEIPEAGPGGIHLIVGTSGSSMPFTYYIGTELAGYDIELARRFAAWLGADLEFKVYDYEGIVPAAISGDVDCVFANLYVTPEREEVIRFSEPTNVGEIGVMVRDTKAGTKVQAGPEYSTFEELSGKKVSMLTGAPFEELVKSKNPDISEFTFFNSTPDMLLTLQSGKTDAVLTNNAIAALAVNRNQDLALFPQELKDGEFGFAFAKGDPRRDSWQAAYDALPHEAVEAAWNKWTGADESVKELPDQDWPGVNGTVRVAACDTLEPMAYVGGDGEPKGFDLEVILMIAKEMDIHVEFTAMEFAAILSSVQSGKADIGAGSIIITEERAQAVDFVEYYPAAFVLIVRKADASGTEIPNDEITEDGIVSSFEKTFLREERWKLFVDGVLTTLFITVLSILFGTILGFAVFMLCRNGNSMANLITRFCIWVVQGMPMVVLLMILYYIIFGNVDINGVAVAVVGFTLTFGAAVFGLLKMGVGTVDKGQYEAACALGYSNQRTFFEIILPQALPHVLPAYKGEIVGLIKATAIVGYIAVQDLTKMGDIVRSRTYEAFFPLIAVSVIYFVLEGLIGSLVGRISVNLDPKRRGREEILKGVRTDDQD